MKRRSNFSLFTARLSFDNFEQRPREAVPGKLLGDHLLKVLNDRGDGKRV